jgi:hypothetical protein
MSKLIFTEAAAPGASAASKVAMYAKTNSKVYTKDDTGVEHLLSQDQFGVSFTIGDGVNQITTGYKGAIQIPFDCTITEVDIVSTSGALGSVIVDIWKDTIANYPPTDADSITSATPPTLITQAYAQDTTLSGWTVTINAGDYLAFNVDGRNIVTCVTISIMGKKL